MAWQGNHSLPLCTSTFYKNTTLIRANCQSDYSSCTMIMPLIRLTSEIILVVGR